ncbi:MAG: hypothetical protein C0485_15220 [Pirellula sp.]|nr:hypothetical protein [Pirellula sp.]
MLGLRLALGAIALMAVLTASMGGLAIIDFEGSEEKPTLELTLGGAGAYWEAVANGARAAAARRGVQLSVLEGVDPAGRATISIVGAGESASCGGGELLSPHLFHVGMANYSAGRICAHYAVKHAAVGSKIIMLVDAAANSASAARLQGFRDTLRYYEGDGQSQRSRQLEVIAGDPADQEIYDLAAAQHADAALVIDFTGGSEEALQNAFHGSARGLQPQLVTFDQSAASLAAIETGKIAAVMTHDPYLCGYQAVDRLVVCHRGDLLGQPAAGRGCIYVPGQLVERGTLAEFRSSLKVAAAE